MQDLRGLLSFSLFARGIVRSCLVLYIVGTKMYQPLVQIHVLAPQFNTPAAQACPNPYYCGIKNTCCLSGSVLLSAACPDPYIVELKNTCRLSGSVYCGIKIPASCPDPYYYLPLVRIRILWHYNVSAPCTNLWPQNDSAACPDPYIVALKNTCRLSGSVILSAAGPDPYIV